MSRNYLSEFSREEIKIGEEDEEIVSLNKRTPTEETISYQRTLLKRANEEPPGPLYILIINKLRICGDICGDTSKSCHHFLLNNDIAFSFSSSAISMYGFMLL